MATALFFALGEWENNRVVGTDKRLIPPIRNPIFKKSNAIVNPYKRTAIEGGAIRSSQALKGAYA
ncbi:hypothetical protein [Methylovulum psychrotolerans]|uniref:hypothetical protein n=1 Tax=Methylovulum psychrotolerans TaxID=1704499 RepID=UPI0011B0437A|nr:hypothetical protein [Methylovulum psychrotolerans]